MQLITPATEAARQRAGAAAFVIPVAGGAACYAEDGSPMNKVVGLGFVGAPSGDALDEIERAFAARGPPRRSNWPTLPIPPLVHV
jgi:hypothetical protein